MIVRGMHQEDSYILKKIQQKYRFDNTNMDLKSKAPITFSVTGILSTGTSSHNHRDTNTQLSQRVYPHPATEPNLSLFDNYQQQKCRVPNLMKTRPPVEVPDQFYGRRNIVDEEDSCLSEYYAQHIRKHNNRTHHNSYSLDSEFIRYASPRSNLSSLEEYHHQQARRLNDNPSPPKRFRPNSPEETYNFYNDKRPASCPKKSTHFPVRISPSPVRNPDHNEVVMTSSINGRFRPPPFFETVLTLRKRLYRLGGKTFPVDEPPSDRNVHKLWRSVEKHKVSYSLQHYFYVASLSNRCFDLVEQIHQKVSRGLLEGSRDHEVNQSYFNFLYGKTEKERYELLRLLERGEISPKDVSKSKQNGSSLKRGEDNSMLASKCDDYKEQIQKLLEEKNAVEKKLEILQRKYDKVVNDSTVIFTKESRIKSKSI